MAFGIISLLLGPLCYVFAYEQPLFIEITVVFSFVTAVTLWISTWVLAAEELRKIRDGSLPISVQGLTKTGRRFGLIGVVVYSLVFCVLLLKLSTSRESFSARDAIINDLGNFAAAAYQYRIRPTSMGGGGGSYTGFVIPAPMLPRNANGVYTATVIDAETIQFCAKWVEDSTATILARLDAEGRLRDPWTYTGIFQ